MREVSPFDLTLSYVALLLEEQRYEEALPILGSLMEMDPSDREARMYRLLLLRILVQQYYLSNPEMRTASRAPSVRARVLQKSRDGLGFCSNWVIRSLARLQPACGSLGSKPALARATAAGLTCVALAMPLTYTVLRRSGAHEPATIDRPPALLSAVDVKTFRPSTPSSTDAAHAPWEIGKAANESRETAGFEDWAVEPDESSPVATAVHPGRTERWIRVDRRSLGIKRRQPAAVVKQSPQKPAEPLHYESQRDLRLRRSASFGAAVVQEIARGTPVQIVEIRGSWVKVQIRERGVSGFVRREFLTPLRSGRPREPHPMEVAAQRLPRRFS